MRVQELRLVADPRSGLAFHPRLSVVFGLSDAARNLLSEEYELMAGGGAANLLARFEVNGALVDVGPGFRRLPTPPVALDVVVQAQHLLEPRLAQKRDDVAAERAALIEAAGAARAHTLALRASIVTIENELERLFEDWEQASIARSQALAAVDDANRDLDPRSFDEYRSAIVAAALLDDELMVSRGSVRGDSIDDIKTCLEAAQTAIPELARAMDGLQGRALVNPHQLQAAISQVDSLLSIPIVAPHPEANALADEWAILRNQLAALDLRHAPLAGTRAEVVVKIANLMAERDQLIAQIAPREISPEDRAELEDAHEKVLEAERKTTARFAGGREEKKFEAAVARQQEILDRLGYPTWSAWVMGERLLDSTTDTKRRAEAIGQELQKLQRDLERSQSKLESDADFQRLSARLGEVERRSKELVGEQADPEAALRSLTVAGELPPEQQERCRALLVPLLEQIEFKCDPTWTIGELNLWAKDQCAELLSAWNYVELLALELDRARAEYEDARERLARVEALGIPDDRAIASHPRVLAARLALNDTEARSRRHRQALMRGSSLLVQATTAARMETQLAEAHASKLELRGVSVELVQDAENRLAVLERKVEQANETAQLQSAPTVKQEHRMLDEYVTQRIYKPQKQSIVGSMPILFNDAFAGLDRELIASLMRRLDVCSSDVQIIYLTSDRELATWLARSIPVERASVVTGSGFFG